MARKRRRGHSPLSDFGTDDDTPDSMDDFELDSQLNSQDISDGGSMECEDTSSSDDGISDKKLYKQVLVESRNLLKLKRDLKRKLSHQSKKNAKSVKKPKETFSRFSVTSFSKVVSAVSASRRDVIEHYGFGSLLNFDKCFVPWKFAKWIAQQVDFKSGDILIGGKVISLTPESVHLVLGVPLGGHPFPRDYSAGRSLILQKFNLNQQTIPSVMFFVDKLTKEIDTLSDEDVFISFLLVALCTFLCPNASQSPCLKYLGIFADIEHARDFDWSGYILTWLFQHIKTFNRGKTSKLKDEGTLGGCLYYLAVLYLDFVDFCPRMISSDIPRISVWKGNMIQSYSLLDSKSNASYGLRPKLDFSDTCYVNSLHLYDSSGPSVFLDDDFLDKLDLVSRCKLPADLKNSICKIVQEHSLNCGVSVELDVTALSRVPYNLQIAVAKLLQYASSVDMKSKKLVLDIMKAITEFPHDPEPSVTPPDNTTNSNVPEHSEPHVGEDASDSETKSANQQSSPIPSAPMLNPSPVQRVSSPNVSRKCSEVIGDLDLVPSQYKLHCSKVNHYQLEKSIQNVSNTNESPCTPSGSSKRLLIPPHGFTPGCGPQSVLKKKKPRVNHTFNLTSQSNIAVLRGPLCDITNLDSDLPETSLKNSVNPLSDDGRQKDVISLSDDEGFVPDSLSPVPRRRCISSSVQKSTSDSEKDNLSPQLTQRTAARVTPNLQSRHVRFASSHSASKPIEEDCKVTRDSSEVQIVSEKTFSQSLRDMTRLGDDMYNKKFGSKPPSAARTPVANIPSASQTPGSSFTDAYPRQPYMSRDSSTGGKLPPHGPRRPIKPGILFQGDYETDKKRISLSPSEIKNYKAICDLANIGSNRDDVIVVGKVRCTFWALGDSLKPDGFVNSFVMSAFCYNLFLKPAGQPEQSKAHYFFANIGAELMKDPDEANQDILCRAFKLSHRNRPLNRCNNLYFPILFNNHWSVFVVNIKDRNFVFFDSLHHKDHEYQEIVRDCVVPSFKLHWDKYVNVAMDFDYGFLYPDMPLQELDNSIDSGIYAMMCIQYWKSPRTVLSKCFDSSDIPKIRVKVANELLLMPGNTGMKDRVFEYRV
ncbi:unnamed protein product [Urochloa decumbens]|uniref:Ubiquitin-like protease family profile domain-containing protein n=1 Tax=Urochloa decumbens TaxID=240449 RepID=A0ABC9E4Q6_9POAL